ncbi:MAG: ABC transporter permease [Myxococcaceae bacterium]
MSVRATLKAYPTLLRIGLAEAVAYRAELFVWVLATTMPLISLALWHAVALEAPVGRFSANSFTAYFLMTFIVRQLTGTWIAWQMNFEVRQGTLSQRLLRPIHPLMGYGAGVLAALPMRVVVSVPIAAILLATAARSSLTHTPTMWMAFAMALIGGWLITYLINVMIGTLALFIESSVKVMDVYLAMFFVFAGYTIPVELFPEWLRAANDWLPFRYQIGLPVELATDGHSPSQALRMLAQQWAYVGGLALAAHWLWHKGLRRFEAYGG